ncbi:MAG TPA: beta-L-arabinofuranosidase domain-containing protein, partial [Anaerolineales bacterium]|nr:beta-L-arabinofuranosidase domain-containing protein [Anaerolineales bacterium]
SGHAVRVLYLSAGAVDLYAENGETTRLASLERTWERLFSRQTHITGGVGRATAAKVWGMTTSCRTCVPTLRPARRSSA